MRRTVAGLIAFIVTGVICLHAEDWPEYRGEGRRGVWNETEILDKFPEGGLKILWRTPVKGGLSGPIVADGRVFVADFVPKGSEATGSQARDGSYVRGGPGKERLLALDEKTGRVLWTQEWDAEYRGVFGLGPVASPTADGDRVYFQGGMGRLACLNVKTGEVLWQLNYATDYGVNSDKWPWFYGFAGSPLVDGPFIVAAVAAPPNAKVIAFDKMTGKEIWRAPSGPSAITAEWGPGTGWPMMITAGGTRQLIFYHPQAVLSLNPESGKTYWEQSFVSYGDVTAAGPVQDGNRLFVSTAYNGTMMLKLDDKKPAATLLWKGKSDSEIQTDGLHSWMSTPGIYGDYIYGICSYGQFRCLNANTGERVWETQAVLKGERVRWAQAFIVRNGDRLFINSDRGELVMVRMSPDGYQELGRTQLIKPTSPPGNRRQLVNVSWVHPAYANKHIYMRNDEEIICASLAADGQ